MNRKALLLLLLSAGWLNAGALTFEKSSAITMPNSTTRGICFKDSVIYATTGSVLYRYDLASGSGSKLVSGLSTPYDVDVDADGTIYVAERGNKRVVAYDAEGRQLRTIDGFTENVNGVTAGPDGRLYVATMTAVHIIGPDTTQVVTQTEGVDKFREVRKVVFDRDGHPFILDYNTGVLQVYSFTDDTASIGFRIKREDGVDIYNRLAGLAPLSDESLVVSSYTDASKGLYRFNADGSLCAKIDDTMTAPWGVATDGADNLYVASGNTIQIWRAVNEASDLTVSYLLASAKSATQTTIEFSAGAPGTLFYLTRPYSADAEAPTADEILAGKSVGYGSRGAAMAFTIDNADIDNANGRFTVYALLRTADGQTTNPVSLTVATHSEVDTVRERYRALLTGEGSANYADAATMARYNAMLAAAAKALTNSSKYDPTAEGLTEFDIDESNSPNDIVLVRELVGSVLMPLALAYNVEGPASNPNPYYKSTATLTRIMRLYDYLSTRNFRSGRELHFTGGGIYLRLTGYFYASFLMRDELARTGRLNEVADMMGWGTRWVVENSLSVDGGESDWSAEAEGNASRSDGVRTIYNNRLLYLLTLGDADTEREARLDYLRRALDNALTPRGAWNGFLKPDYTGFHHRGAWGNAYNTDALHVAAQMAYALAGTSYAVSEASATHLANGLEALFDINGKYSISRGLCGRFPANLTALPAQIPAYAYISRVLPQGALRERMASICATLYAPSYSVVDEDLVRNVGCAITFSGGMGSIALLNSVAASAEPLADVELNRTFPYAAAQVHRRADWVATVKGYSKYAWDFETNGAENWYGRNQSFGQLSVYSGRDAEGVVTAEASGVGYDGYDWSHIPGTTTPALSLAELLADAKAFQWARFSNEAQASGVTDGRNGAYGFRFSDRTKGQSASAWTAPKLTARKSYFFCDDLIVALGSDIDNTKSSYDSHTTILQNLLVDGSPTLLLNGSAIGADFSYDQSTEGAATLTDVAGNGYYLANAKGLHVARSKQTSRNDTDTADTEGEYVTAWINHGSKISAGSYAYAVKVRGAESVADLAASPADYFRIEQQDAVAHSVSFGQKRGITLFEGGGTLADELVVTASDPCAIWIDTSNDGVVLSVANPDLGYYESGAAFGQFPVQAWSIPSSKLYMATPVMPVDVTLRGIWKLADEAGKTSVTAVDEAAQTTTLRFEGSNAESLTVGLKPASTGLTAVGASSEASLFPNPASEVLYLRNANLAGEGGIIVCDLSGRTLLAVRPTGADTERIDVSSLAPGHYLLRIGQTTLRFFKK